MSKGRELRSGRTLLDPEEAVRVDSEGSESEGEEVWDETRWVWGRRCERMSGMKPGGSGGDRWVWEKDRWVWGETGGFGRKTGGSGRKTGVPGRKTGESGGTQVGLGGHRWVWGETGGSGRKTGGPGGAGGSVCMRV